MKQTAQAAKAGIAQLPEQQKQREAAQRSLASLDDLSLGDLVNGLIEDWHRLYRQELQLARVEVQENLAQIMRNMAVMAGGQLMLYTSVVILATALVVLLGAMMPSWLAAMLVGLLTLLVGGLRVWSGLRAFKQLKLVPRQTVTSLHEDVEVVKEHLTP